ncbi:MAG: single-stranded DNA-binding protein [Nitrospira sp.]|nr:single-stranded DNA-binding protein [Nitrospira sp.]
MDTQLSSDSTNIWPLTDLNALSVTGTLVQEPDLLVGATGEIVAVVVLAIEGKLQASASGTMIRHTYFVHAFAMSPVADWLATMRAGTRLRILGSLDYLYRADAPTVAERVVLSIRIEELALHA